MREIKNASRELIKKNFPDITQKRFKISIFVASKIY